MWLWVLTGFVIVGFVACIVVMARRHRCSVWQFRTLITVAAITSALCAFVAWGYPVVRDSRTHQASLDERDAGITAGSRSSPENTCERSGPCAALAAACAELRSSTIENVADRWATASRAMVAAIQHVPWFAHRFAWLSFHALDGVCAACEIEGYEAIDLRKRIHAAAAHGNQTLGDLLRDERSAICWAGAAHAQATTGGGASWTDENRARWDGACARLLTETPEQLIANNLTPGASPSAHGSVVVRVPGSPEVEVCPGLRAAATKRDRMVDASLDISDWIAFGVAIASCPPSEKPWEILRLSGGADQFVRDYITPYVNGDVLQRRDAFQNSNRALFNRMVANWNIDG